MPHSICTFTRVVLQSQKIACVITVANFDGFFDFRVADFKRLICNITVCRDAATSLLSQRETCESKEARTCIWCIYWQWYHCRETRRGRGENRCVTETSCVWPQKVIVQAYVKPSDVPNIKIPQSGLVESYFSRMSDTGHNCQPHAVTTALLPMEIQDVTGFKPQIQDFSHKIDKSMLTSLLTRQKYFLLASFSRVSLVYLSPTRGPNRVPLGISSLQVTLSTWRIRRTWSQQIAVDFLKLKPEPQDLVLKLMLTWVF